MLIPDKMSTQLFVDKVIKVRPMYVVSATDGVDFYHVNIDREKLMIWASNGDAMVADDVDCTQQHITLYCKRIDDELYFTAMLGRSSGRMILYKDGKRLHELESNGYHVRHVQEKGPVIKYSVVDQDLIQYFISGSEITKRFINIKGSSIQHSSARYTSVNNTDKYLYIASDSKIIRYKHKTGEQLVIYMFQDPDSVIRFSANGEYAMGFNMGYSETLSKHVQICSMIKMRSLTTHEERKDIEIVYDTGNTGFGVIDERIIAVVDGYVLFKNTHAFSRAMYNPRVKTPFISNVSGSCAWHLPVSYKYSDIDGGRLYTHDVKACEIRTYGFKWNIKRVGIQSLDIQKTVITTYLCLKRAIDKFMPRNLIYMIIDYIYARSI